MNPQTADARIAVIVNAKAGCGHPDDIKAAIEAHFRAAGKSAQVTLVKADALNAAVEHAMHEGARTIVAGGGDGTLSTVASLLVDTDIALGVLPLGTLNHFAKDQRIPLDLAAAVRTIVAGHIECVDVGDVNGRIFINNSSLGIYPDIVRLRERQRKRFGIGKVIALAWATWLVLRRDAALHVRVDVDTEATDRMCRTPFAFIGNNEYVLEGLGIGGRNTLQAGVLSLYTSRRGGRLGVLRLVLQAVFGHLRNATDFDALTAKGIVIETRRRRISVATDGEVSVVATPLRYRSRPRALRVLVPQRDATGDA
jgi:diacylglycerol kinase family enzyme